MSTAGSVTPKSRFLHCFLPYIQSIRIQIDSQDFISPICACSEIGYCSLDRLIPITFPKLQCTYVHGQYCDACKKFHKAFTILSHHYWGTYCEMHIETDEEAVATLCTAKVWWCDHCKKPLFKVSINFVFF